MTLEERVTELESKLSEVYAYLGETHDYVLEPPTADTESMDDGIDKLVEAIVDGKTNAEISDIWGGHKAKRPAKPSKPTHGGG